MACHLELRFALVLAACEQRPLAVLPSMQRRWLGGKACGTSISSIGGGCMVQGDFVVAGVLCSACSASTHTMCSVCAGCLWLGQRIHTRPVLATAMAGDGGRRAVTCSCSKGRRGSAGTAGGEGNVLNMLGAFDCPATHVVGGLAAAG